MTDYAEEQTNELEALESIYPEELKVLETEPRASFEISLVSQKDEYDEDIEEASCTLQITYTATYPDEAPLVEVTESENLDDDQTNEVLNLIHSEAEENLGMVMVFTLVSAVQEKLTCIVEDMKKKKSDVAERKKEAEEALEQKKFEGTRVSIENFLAWKANFDADMEALNKKQKQNDISKSKLTGKELFMKDASMMESDMQFLQEEGESVEVDESLFQDFEDIDLPDEELDIED